MRAYVGGIFHEANAFSPVSTGLEDFEFISLTPMDDPTRGGGWIGCNGFMDAIADSGDTAHAGVFANATPSAPCDRATYATLKGRLMTDIEDAGDLDAVLLFLHGAQTAEGHDDCAGDIVSEIRHMVKSSVPIGVLLDLHANVSSRLLEQATLVAACKEYPHTDFDKVAAHIWRVIRSKKPLARPTWRPVPAFPAATTTDGPMRRFADEMVRLEQRECIASISAIHGFPHADVVHGSAGILSYAFRDHDAGLLTENLAIQFFEAASTASGDDPGLTVSETVEYLASGSARPLLIAERSDNPGAGGAGDATHLLRALIEANSGSILAGIWHDPAVVSQAIAAGVGATINLHLGGRSGALSGEPIPLRLSVTSILENATQPMFGDAARAFLGTSVLLTSSNFAIVVATERQQPFSPVVFSDHGIDPRLFDTIVLKSTNHFYQLFRPLVAEVIYCDAPGAASENLAALPYQNLRRPIWPLDSKEACLAVLPRSSSQTV
ncbi:MAG: M81 family metallopeptidase [Pseudomonadota bacterium]